MGAGNHERLGEVTCTFEVPGGRGTGGSCMTVQDILSVVPMQGRRFRAYSAKHLDELTARSAAPADPIYRLVFPQADMLPPELVGPISTMLARGAPEPEIQEAAHS